MNLKVLCHCGAKFSFDVEPVNGQMPCAITCPQCSTDATAVANQLITQNLAATAMPAKAPAPGLRVAAHALPPKTEAPVAAATASIAPGQFCSRHPRTRVESHCHVCGKPICMDCMKVFGYLCSATCRHQAEQQRIQVPECEFKRSVADSRDWGKVWAVLGGIVLLLVALIGLWGWFTFSGSQPKVYYSVKADKEGWYTHAEFLDPQHILVTDQKQIALHDIDTRTVVWTRAFSKDPSVEMAEKPKIILMKDSIWVCLSDSVLQLDRKNGEILKSVPMDGIPTNVRHENGEILITANAGELKESVMHIELASGAVKTEELALAPIARTTRKRDFSKAAPTQGVLVEQELNDPTVSGRERSQFIPAGENIVELQVRMVEEHFNEVQTIKPNKGPTKLDENVSASTPVAPVAEEIFNDLARSRDGGFRTIDESVYGVTLRRNTNDIPEWHGEVTGPPSFFPLQTVDVLTAGKGIWIFNKQNKLIKQDKLAHSVSGQFTYGLATGGPCFESDGTLYFFDQGVLAAYPVSGGEVRWRLPSVGISSVQSDGKGSLYVCTTTASPEDIQYSEQIKLQDRIQPVLMKVEAKSGKVLWKVNHLGVGCYLAGKYLYASNQQVRSGPSLAVGLAQALGSPTGGSVNFRLSRLDPDSGKEIWGYYKEGSPEQLDFSKNRILLQYDDRVVVLKFLTF